MSQFLFSTGKLSVAPYGVSFDSTHVIGAIQSADFEVKYETKEVREANSITVWPVDNVMYDASGSLKVVSGDLAEKLMVYCAGATASSSGGNNIYTGTATGVPSFVKIKLEGKLSDGRAATLEIDRARGRGLPLSMKRDDYTMPDVEFGLYPVDTSATPWKLTIAQ